MRKILLLILNLMIITSILLAACGGDQTEPPPEPEEPMSADESDVMELPVIFDGGLINFLAERTFKALITELNS